MGFDYLMNKLDPNLTPKERTVAQSVSNFMRKRIREFILHDEPNKTLWPQYQGGHKMVFDAHPHMEYLPEDTLTGFPAQVYVLTENHR